MIAVPKENMSLPKRRPLAVTIVTLACCLLLLAASYKRGIERGLSTAIEYGPFSFQIQLACAITDSVYRFNLGYACATQVYKKLVEIQTGGDDSENAIPRLHNGALINRSIAEASNLGPLTPGTFDTGQLMTPYYNDLGMVDFIRLGFWLFGPTIESLYKLFFALLAVSTLAFVLAFSGNVPVSLAAIAITFSFFAEINSNLFSPLMPAVYSIRYPSVLAVIPALHLALLVAWGGRPTFAAVIFSAIQVAILLFAMTIRFAAIWGFVTILAVAAVMGLCAVVTEKRQAADWPRAVTAGGKKALCWPVILLVTVAILHGVFMRNMLHPVYDTDEALAGHVTWHSWFQNYAWFDPEAMKLSGLSGAAAQGDDISWQAARLYAERTHLVKDPASLYATLTKFGTRIVLHDKLMRRVFLGYVMQHPLRALEVYLFAKPADLVQKFWAARAAFPRWVVLAGFGLTALVSACLFILPWNIAEGASVMLIVVGMGLVSALPMIAGAPDLVYLGDMLIVWPTAFYLGVPMGMALLIARVSPSLITAANA